MIEGPPIPAVHEAWDTKSRWSLVVAKPWEYPEEHINVKEARVCLMALRRLTRTVRNLNKVALCLSDNLVSVMCFEKGRSSSGKLNGLCRRAAAYVIGGKIQWRLRHMASERNPSDEPSRWFQDRKHPQQLAGANKQDDSGEQYGHVPVTSFEASPPLSSPPCLAPYSSSSPTSLGMFLELFSGTAHLTTALHDQGIPCLPDIEISKGDKYDLLRQEVQDIIIKFINEGIITYVHCGTPCTVFSRARHILRNFRKARLKEQQGVALALFTARVILALRRKGGFFSVENPLTSTLWQFGPIHRLFALKDVIFIQWHMCAYDTPYKKPTGLLTNIPLLSGLAKKCPGGHSHKQLRGSETVWEGGHKKSYSWSWGLSSNSLWTLGHFGPKVFSGQQIHDSFTDSPQQSFVWWPLGRSGLWPI